MEGFSFKNPLDALKNPLDALKSPLDALKNPSTPEPGQAISRVPPPNSDIESLREQLNRIEKKLEEGFAAIVNQKGAVAVPDLPALFGAPPSPPTELTSANIAKLQSVAPVTKGGRRTRRLRKKNRRNK